MPKSLLDAQSSSNSPIICLENIEGFGEASLNQIEITASPEKSLKYSDASSNTRSSRHSFPFGHQSATGSEIALVCREWFDSQNQIAVTMEFDWMNLPKTPQPYDPKLIGNDGMVVEVDLVDNISGTVTQLGGDIVTLIDSSGHENLLTFTIPDGKIPDAAIFSSNAQPRDQDFYLRISLVSNNISDPSNNRTITVEKNEKIIKKLYSPEVNGVRVSYTKEISVLTGTLANGISIAAKDAVTAGANKKSAIYLGFKGWKPGQTMSIVPQIQDGVPRGQYSWQYLQEGGNWDRLPDARDGTGQLSQTDVLEFTLPQNVGTVDRLLPAGRVWIRALIDENSMDTPVWIDGIMANAAIATLIDPGKSIPLHFENPIPPKTVKGLKVHCADIERVRQPLSGFGGRGAETASDFHKRAASLLSHRNRAVSTSDYRRLLIQKFPELVGAVFTKIQDQVLKVSVISKPLPGSTLDTPPVLSTTKISEMKEFLATHSSRWADFEVISASTAKFDIQATVSIREELDEQLALRQVEQTLASEFSYQNILAYFGFDGSSSMSQYQLLLKILAITQIETVDSFSITDSDQKAVDVIDMAAGVIPVIKVNLSPSDQGTAA